MGVKVGVGAWYGMVRYGMVRWGGLWVGRKMKGLGMGRKGDREMGQAK